MKWGVETIVDEVKCTVDLKLKQVDENGPIKEWHSPNYDMTFWPTYEQAVANLNQVRAAWQRYGSFSITG
jgi:hypothetical protein